MGMNALEVRRRVMLAQPHEAVASGAVASFRTDVLSPLKMSFDLLPIQDLHGQDAPYPPGGGKNLFGATLSDCKTINTSGTWSNNAYTMNGVTFTVYEYDGYIERIATSGTATATIALVVGGIELTEGVTYIFNGCPSGGSSSKYEIMAIKKPQEGSSGIDYNSHDYGNGVTYTETETTIRGLQCVIRNGQNSNGLVFYPMVRLATVADGTFAPYSNICPITGHDGFTRTGTGKNLCGGDRWLETGSGTVDLENRTVSGTNANSLPALYKVTPPFKENTQYTMIVKWKTTGTGGRTGFAFRYTDNTIKYLNDDNIPSNTVGISVFTSTSGKTLRGIERGTYSGTKTYYVDGCGIFEGVLSASDFEAYKGTSIETTFPTPPGTVYGGHVRDNGDGTGTLVVKRSDLIDLGGLTWNKYNNVFYATINDIAHGSNEYYVISDSYESAVAVNGAGASGSWGDCTIRGNNSTGKYIYIKDTAQTSLTKEQFKEYVTGKKAVYLLSTPVSYTLPMTALQSLIGQNNIWVDNADSVSVEYWGH